MDNEVIQHSVTRNDYSDNAGRTNGILHFWAQPFWTNTGSLPPQPPPYWSFGRDMILRSTIHHESVWAGAVYVATTKMAALTWKVKGLELRSRKTREMLLESDGYRGWVQFLQRHLQDFLLTDNGAFIEIVRASSNANSKIIGVMHLDSNRCLRTGDPDIPVIYRDRMNYEHEIKSHQIICLSDMPSPADMYYGVGTCAASRAYRDIYKMAALENYLVEKVTGRTPLAIHFVNNISWNQLQQATAQIESERAAKGFISYMGAYVIPTIDPSAPPQVSTIQLAGLPENYNVEDERRSCKLSYANSVGLDPQEVDPQLLASRALGTGAQARVIDDKASGKGLAAWRQNFAQLLNEFVVPEETTFYFKESDLRDQLQEEQVKTQRVTRIQTMSAGQFITPNMGTQLLVDAEDIPPQFLVEPDSTPVEDNSSDTKPVAIKPTDIGSATQTEEPTDMQYSDPTQLSAAQIQSQGLQQEQMERQAKLQPRDVNPEKGTRAMYEPREKPQAKKQ